MKNLIYDTRQKELLLPEAWEELTATQFIEVAGLLHAGIADKDILYDKALYYLSGRSLYNFLRIPLYVRKAAYEHIEWVFTSQQVTEQLLPVYDGLYGPASDFNNLVLAEFHHSEAAFHKLIHDKEASALDDLAAVLYREPKPGYDKEKNIDGDIRVKFNHGSLEYYTSKVRQWPLAVKQGIAIWYNACRQNLLENYKPAFQGSGQTKDVQYFEGLFGMIRGLSGPKYGTFKEVEQMNVHTAFMDIVLSLQEAEELKQQTEQQ